MNHIQKTAAIFLIAAALLANGCAGAENQISGLETSDSSPEPSIAPGEPSDSKEEAVSQSSPENGELNPEESETKDSSQASPPALKETDWSALFGAFHGAAVLYDEKENSVLVYQPELARTRRSPCSTFKIISSLSALENGILTPEHSARAWSGEVFWNEDWNRDLDFETAFRTSCVWYFRELIDEIGAERMGDTLERLQYGNQDISDWEGRLNTNNQNRALTGFWIESSLKISPIEQTRVMERIFGQDGYASGETVERLKQVMLTKEEGELAIYGKTGMGKENGVTVDAWFTGFAETPEGKCYFCVYLGRSDGIEATSTAAKELAVRIVTDHWKMEVS